MPSQYPASPSPIRPELRTQPRFPDVPPAAGHYESFYLKACHPEGGLGIWIRYTVFKRPDQAPKGFRWFTLFDSAAGVRASKVGHAYVGAGEDHYIQIGDSRFEPGHVIGNARSERLDASWELEFEPGAEPLFHLPSARMYRARIPRTKLLTPYPGVSFNGWVKIGRRVIEVHRWPGTVGHNWGSEHAQRAIWLHGTNFAGHQEDWLDLAIGRIRVGPFTSPWIANGALFLDGQRHQLGGLARAGATVVQEAPERCHFAVPGKEIALEGTVSAERSRLVSWIYAQPQGGERQTVNCSVADMRLKVSRPGHETLTLEVKGGAAYELQMAERYPEVPVQPFADG